MALRHFHLLLLSSLLLGSVADKGAFSFILSSSGVDPVYGVSLASTVPAVDLALEYINSNSNLLPGTNLSYGEVGSLECPAEGSRLEEVLDEVDIGVLGYTCSRISTDSLINTGMFNFTPMIQYTAISADLLFADSDSTGQPAVFTIHPTPSTYAEAVLAVVRQFSWQRFLIISDLTGGRFYDEVLNNIKMLTATDNQDLTLFQLAINGTVVNNGFSIPTDVRIIFMNVEFSKTGRQVMCEAFKLGLLFPRYVWITYSGDYSTLVSSDASTACNYNQTTQFLDGILTLLPAISNEADNGQAVRAIQRIPGFSHLSYFAFDAVMVMAQAVNDTLAGWSNNSPDWSFCEVENERNETSLVKCFVRQKILNVNISGATGAISFNSQGNRTTSTIHLQQIRLQDLPLDEPVAQISIIAGKNGALTSQFEFQNGENETTIFRGPIPADGTPLKNISLLPLALVVVYYVLATIGILFSIFCLIFNIVFRKRKIVKLISPTLNYFVIAGGIMLYSLVYFRLLPIQTKSIEDINCNLKAFLVCVGYVLCFAPVLMKTLRVYYIFHNPSPRKRAFKDWHLVMGTSILVGIIAIMVFISFAVPALRGKPMPVPDVERPYGRTEDGFAIENCIYECYGFDASLAWIALEYVYLLLLQLAAFILAILIRKVEVKVLNDSKQMMAIVYSTSTIMVVLGILTFAVSSMYILREVLFTGLIMVATTIFLAVTFIPKMVDLYKDPEGEGVFGKTTENSSGHQPIAN